MRLGHRWARRTSGRPRTGTPAHSQRRGRCRRLCRWSCPHHHHQLLPRRPGSVAVYRAHCSLSLGKAAGSIVVMIVILSLIMCCTGSYIPTKFNCSVPYLEANSAMSSARFFLTFASYTVDCMIADTIGRPTNQPARWEEFSISNIIS